MATTLEAPKLDRDALIRVLRAQVPCMSDDPLTVDQYERALREWASLPEWQRTVVGFGSFWAGHEGTML